MQMRSLISFVISANNERVRGFHFQIFKPNIFLPSRNILEGLFTGTSSLKQVNSIRFHDN